MAIDISTLPSPDELRNRVQALPAPDALRAAAQGTRPSPPTPQQIAATRTLDETPTAERFLVGVGKGLNDLGVGAKQKVLKLAAAIGVPDADKAEQRLQAVIDEEKALTEPLTHTTAGFLGQLSGTAIPAALVPGAGTLGGAALGGAALGGLEPTATGESELENAIGGAAGGTIGHLGGAGIAKGAKALLAKVRERAAQRAAARAPQTAALANAQDLGLSVPPSLVPAGAGAGKTVQGLAGAAKTVQEGAAGNQPKIQQTLREAFQIPEGTQIKEGLDAVIANAGRAYDDLRAYPNPLQATEKFVSDIKGLTERTEALKDFPSLGAHDAVTELQQELLKPSVSADTAIALTKQLRSSGRLNRISGDPKTRDLGSAQLKAASAVENMIQDNLDAAGVPELAEDFRHARKIIAQAHDVSDALAADGNTVDVRKLAKLRKKGVNADGDVGKLARFGADFPAAAAPPSANGGGGPFSVIDYVAGLGLAAHNPALAAAVALRPLARKAINSSAGQKLLLPRAAATGDGLVAKGLSAAEGLAPSIAPLSTAAGVQNGQELALPVMQIHGNLGSQ